MFFLSLKVLNGFVIRENVPNIQCTTKPVSNITKFGSKKYNSFIRRSKFSIVFSYWLRSYECTHAVFYIDKGRNTFRSRISCISI